MSVEDDARFFQNKFPRFEESDQKNLLDSNSRLLDPELVQSFQHSASNLLANLESHIPEEIDWKDASVYTGASGYILLYLHLFKTSKNQDYLKAASALVGNSVKKLRGSKTSFLCGDAGPLALAAIVYDKQEQHTQVEWCVSKLIELKKKVLDHQSHLPNELLFGRVGYLYALLMVKKGVKSQSIDPALIRSVVNAIIESGKALSRKRQNRVPLVYEWHDKNYLGAAHGVAGILSILLQIKDVLTSSEISNLIRPTVDELRSHIFPTGNMASSSSSSSDKLVHWCHGAPSAVFVFALAFQVYNDKKYLDIARKCAEVVWSRGLLKKGYGLCHGTAGNGYALLYMYQVTKEQKYLYMAVQFAKWCQDYGKHGCRTADRPFSLFEGLAGTIYFLSDIQNPGHAKFPAFIL